MANVEKLHWHELETPKEYGLSVKPQMLQVEARILPNPTPIYSAGTDAQGPRLGTWNLRRKRLSQPSTIRSYGLLYLPGNLAVGDNELQSLMRAMLTGFGNLGMSMPNVLPAFLRGNPQGDLKMSIAQLLAKTHDAFKRKADLLIFIIHGGNERLYKVLKNLCDVRFGVASQGIYPHGLPSEILLLIGIVMLRDKCFSSGGQMQYIANIALKVNVKLGGVNSTVSEPLFRKNRWMMVGGKIYQNLLTATI